ncbi:MAG: AMP-binding protein [Archangium sp.]|nr:AMP-binding protein [Archangium sp.]MDP3569195.1 AMP-binding protein [Archangium sp.]
MNALFPRLEAPGDDVALKVGGGAVTSLQLAEATAALRARVTQAGFGAGARIAVWTQGSLETAIALVAGAAAGFEVVPLDPKLGPLELSHIVKDAAPVMAFGADPAAVAGRIAVETLPLSPALRAHPGPRAPTREVDDAPLLILYTSGTTGLPKGAVLTARNVAFDLDALAKAWRWTAADTVVHALPLFHVHGLVLGLYGSIRVGGALNWFPRFLPREISEALSEGTTVFFAVPTMFHRLSEAAEADPEVIRGLRHARLLVSGSAALPQRDQLRLEALTGRRVLERYGLTETLINCAVRLDDPPAAGVVGAAIDGIELKLVDDERRTLDARDDSTIGEIAVRGPHVFAGYLNRPDATAAVKDADGWFFTGDLACMKPDGRLRIVGRRATDLIKCGGYKVGAGEVEAALLEHPAVREAAVLGAPDDDLGERIVAYVVLSRPAPAQELQDFVASQLSPHKRPREVHFVDELPRNAMGKVVKAKLRRG